MTDSRDLDVALLTSLIDPYMRRIVNTQVDAVEVILDVMGTLMSPPVQDMIWYAGGLYGVFADMSDIVDGYPFSYGDNAEAVAQQVITEDAHHWLDMPHDAEGLESYLSNTAATMEVLPSLHGGVANWPPRPPTPSDGGNVPA